MRERAGALVGKRAARELAVSTFHALGVRMLREDGERVGLKARFSILDADDVLGLLRDLGGCSDNALARRWQWTISLWKNQGLDSAAALDLAYVACGRFDGFWEKRLKPWDTAAGTLIIREAGGVATDATVSVLDRAAAVIDQFTIARSCSASSILLAPFFTFGPSRRFT